SKSSRIFLNLLVWVLLNKFVEPSDGETLRSLAEGPTRLPCQFRMEGHHVVQVTWYKEGLDGSKEQIITGHHTEGHTEFGRFSGRVYFEKSDPTLNSALVIRTTELSDEGKYICHVSTFPFGNFEAELSLTVWTTPISSLEPVVLVERQQFHVAATCRSVARPSPRLSWDTDLPGQAQNRSSEAGAVSSHFSLHPLRSMNGKKLDCLVWHPTQDHPRRLSNRLVVHYPPDPTISGYDGNWHVGLEQASLQCNGGGNPKAETFTWTRNDGPLPEGVFVQNETLVFNRPLSFSDSGLYQCMAKNYLGPVKAEIEISVAETKKTSFDSLLMIIVGVIVGLLLLLLVISVVLVNHYHKRKNKKLEMELIEKKEQISTLSRQASFRRMNSVSTDHHIQAEESTPLRVEGTLRNSLSSLGVSRCRDSRSTLSGGRGGLDTLGRPVLYNTSRRSERIRGRELERDGDREDGMGRMDSVSLDSHLQPIFHPPLHPSLPPYERTADVLRPVNGKAIIPTNDRTQQHLSLDTGYPVLTDEEEEQDRFEDGRGRRSRTEIQGEACDQDSKINSFQMSKALTNNFQYSNGILQPKANPNAILIHPKGQIV
uniref:Ig-like domain-containing protein n=1 Tax=Scleropages formosus TaxID=113540 RepID=A0A8C9TGZ0_SCLFO